MPQEPKARVELLVRLVHDAPQVLMALSERLAAGGGLRDAFPVGVVAGSGSLPSVQARSY